MADLPHQEELNWFQNLVRLKNSGFEKFTSFRNCRLVICCWALIGAVTASSVATNDSTRFIVFFVMIYVYLVAYCLRQTSFVRKRPGKSTVLSCTAVVGIVGAILVSRFGVTQLNVYEQMKIGTSIFAFVEIVKPTCDFGLVPMFMTMPVARAFEQYKNHATLVPFVVVAHALFFTMWILPSNVDEEEEHLEKRDDRVTDIELTRA